MTASLPIDRALLAALARACAPAPWYVVGGFLRDALLGRPSPDLDIAVAADPGRVARRLAGAIDGTAFPLGAEHGVFRVTLRAPLDGIRHVDVAALRGSIDDDLRLRDFTINAVAWRPEDGALIDPLGGEADLRAGLLRLVGDRAVRDDPVRGMRALRFAAHFGFALEPASAAVIRRDAPLLTQTSGERQRDELMAVLDTPAGGPMLRLADDLGLLDVLLPELIPSKGCIQPREHHYDVFDHCVETVAVLDGVLQPAAPDAGGARARWAVLWEPMPEAATLRERYGAEIAEGRTHRAVLKLAGLLHDVSKPETKTVQGGRTRFFGHDELGARKAATITERLRFTARETRLVELLIADHLRPGQLSNGRHLPSKRALYRFFRDLGDAAPDLLLLNLADHAAARGPAMPEAAWAGHCAYIHWILSQRSEDENLVRPPRLVTGNDLMSELKLAPGPLIGRLLDAVREAQATGRVATREQALKLARRQAAREERAASSPPATSG